MIMILGFTDRVKFVEHLSKFWVLIKDLTTAMFLFCCCFCCNIVAAITKETILGLQWQYHLVALRCQLSLWVADLSFCL